MSSAPPDAHFSAKQRVTESSLRILSTAVTVANERLLATRDNRDKVEGPKGDGSRARRASLSFYSMCLGRCAPNHVSLLYGDPSAWFPHRVSYCRTASLFKRTASRAGIDHLHSLPTHLVLFHCSPRRRIPMTRDVPHPLRLCNYTRSCSNERTTSFAARVTWSNP